MILLAGPKISLSGVRPELLLGLMILDGIFAEIGKPLIITSLRDGKHSERSLHYAGAAADIRSKHLSQEEKLKVITRGRSALGGRHFDFILEDNGGANEHFHVEYQPRQDQL